MSADSFEGTRKDLNRAIRRLGILEWVMLAAAAALALGGGWLTAWLLQGWGLPFRVTWTLASVLLFGIPGVKVLLNENRAHSLDPPETDG
jgi:hypothetical protein